MDALELIKSRRSTRSYSTAPVEDAMLDSVIDAGRLAPSGGNNQTTHFIVICDRTVLDRLAELVKAEFAKMEVTEGMYPSMAKAILASKTPRYVFHYDAPVLILTASDSGYYNRFADCACAIENMMLTANALDLGSCWINTVRFVQDDPEINAFLRTLGMEEGEVVCGGVAVGFPDSESGLPAREPLPRTGNKVEYIG